MDLQAVRAENPLPRIVGAQIRLQRAGGEWKACCPFHAEKSPSFTIFAGGNRFHCFGCGASGDVLDYVGQLHSVGLVEAARMLGAGELPKVALPTLPTAEPRDRSDEARAIWKGTVDATGTPAESYLRARGITMPPPPDMRFAQLSVGRSQPMPCLVAAVRNVSGDVTGIQRIFLREDGSAKADILKPKLSLGKVAGGAIRLGRHRPGDVLTVCEGPEDGLSLVQMFGLAVWVAAGATMLSKMRFPRGVSRISIAADNDATGRKQADHAAAAFKALGNSCRIIMPKPAFKDFNDELRGVSDGR